MSNDFTEVLSRGTRKYLVNKKSLIIDFLFILILVVIIYYNRDYLFKSWMLIFNSWSQKINLECKLEPYVKTLPGFFPKLNLLCQTNYADVSEWWVASLIVMFFLGLNLWGTKKYLPYKYFMGLLLIIQISSQAFFYFWPGLLPVSVSSYLIEVMQQGYVLLLLTPVLFGLSLYLFPLRRQVKYGATLVATLFLMLVIPHQALIVALLLTKGSILLMPILFLLFGLLPQFVSLMGIYSFAVSLLPPDGQLRNKGQLVI